MSKLDRLFNTYSKRVYWLLAILGITHIYWLVQNYQVGQYLALCANPNDIYDILDFYPLYNTFFGNLAICYLDEYTLLETVYYAFGFLRIAGLIVTVLLLAGDLPKCFKGVKWLIGVGILLTLAVHVTLAAEGFQALNALTTQEAMDAVNFGGLIYQFGSLLHMLYILFLLFLFTYQVLIVRKIED